jgi:hypothetical protein
VQTDPEVEKVMTAEARKGLDAWVGARREAFDTAGRSAQAAILATFLRDELKITQVDAEGLYTLYVVMGWPAPGNPRAQLQNAQQRDKYFLGFKDGKTELSHSGENFGRTVSLDKK